MATSQRQTVSIEGRKLQLSNLDKVIYRATGTTKRDIFDYYRQIAPVMLPHCRDRAVTRKRWPHGVDEDGSGQMFFQKNIGAGTPDWVEVRTIQHSDHVNRYPLVNDLPTLTWLAQLAALELHVPQWRFGEGDEKLPPDRLVLDLDPGEGVSLRTCAEVARLARDILDGMGLETVPVTSGSKGIHLYAALDGSQSSDQASQVARELARALEADHPDDITSVMKRAERTGKVFIDWSQNNAAKTTIAPYSLRGRAHPTVAAPRTWRELASPHLKQLDYHEVLARVERRGDPMAGIEEGGRSSDGRGSGERDGDDDGERHRDRLAVYRSKRDAAKTPEPVPGPPRRAARQAGGVVGANGDGAHGDGASGARASGNGAKSGGTNGDETNADGANDDEANGDEARGDEANGDEANAAEANANPAGQEAGLEGRNAGPLSFVIQRHDARRLHYDFRLEHDGVLVSWALPRGVPLDTKRNHLAVPSEDHPLEYGSFEGTIPKGEYGAGTVEIWDAGTYDLSKWRDDEVIATLNGAPDGGLGGIERSFALFRTKNDPGKPQWMIHLMDRDPRDEAWSESKHAPGARGENAADRAPAIRSRRANGGGDARGAAAGTRRTGAYRPMLASPGSVTDADLRDEAAWSFEMKWDGMRAIVTIDGDDVRLHSRAGNEVTASYPDLAGVAAAVNAHSCVLDAEIVALDRRGVPSFERLQQRMNVTTTREIVRARAAVPVTLMVFDVLEVNGTAAIDLSYAQRRELLLAVADDETEEPVRVPPVFEGDFEAALATSAALGLEGVVAKRLDADYAPGVRSTSWRKLTHERTADVVVVGWRPSQSGGSGLASLLVAAPGPDGLSYAGRVGTGFSEAQRRDIRAELERSARSTPPAADVPAGDARDARWVTPRRVAEVRYRQRTSEGRLRHPVWRGWRPDKSVDDLVPLAD